MRAELPGRSLPIIVFNTEEVRFDRLTVNLYYPLIWECVGCISHFSLLIESIYIIHPARVLLRLSAGIPLLRQLLRLYGIGHGLRHHRQAPPAPIGLIDSV